MHTSGDIILDDPPGSRVGLRNKGGVIEIFRFGLQSDLLKIIKNAQKCTLYIAKFSRASGARFPMHTERKTRFFLAPSARFTISILQIQPENMNNALSAAVGG